MSTRERAETFTKFVGLELKGQIISHGLTANAVADATGRSRAALNRWLNGRVEIPLTVLCEACEVIEVDPQNIVDTAYNRMAVMLGESDGSRYEADDVRIAREEAEWQERL